MYMLTKLTLRSTRTESQSYR